MRGTLQARFYKYFCSHGNLTNVGHVCPRCLSKNCHLPTECAICELTLVSSPHLARSYHHLFPLKPFVEKTVSLDEASPLCAGCLAHNIHFTNSNNDRMSLQCEGCQQWYCKDCDEFCHYTLYSCPMCIRIKTPGG